jgi:hypothetical protein
MLHGSRPAAQPKPLDGGFTSFTRKTVSNLKTIEKVNVTGIEKSDY